jgi:hypothetical protein
MHRPRCTNTGDAFSTILLDALLSTSGGIRPPIRPCRGRALPLGIRRGTWSPAGLGLSSGN